MTVSPMANKANGYSYEPHGAEGSGFYFSLPSAVTEDDLASLAVGETVI